jgi:folate-dependent tRNA-U54 methylase TrmFO/GidA
MTGAILQKLADTDTSPFTPVNAQFGLVPPLPDPKLKKDVKRMALAERALKDMKEWLEEQNPESRSQKPEARRKSKVLTQLRRYI